MINLEYIFRTKGIYYELEYAQALFDNRLIVSIDPGAVNLAGVLFMKGTSISNQTGEIKIESGIYKAEFKRRLLRKGGYQQDAGIDRLIDQKNAFNEDFREELNDLSVHHGKTMNPDEYQSHLDTFKKHEESLLSHYNSLEQRQMNGKSRREKERYWRDFVNFIFEMDRCMNPDSDKAPVILFGDGKFRGGI